MKVTFSSKAWKEYIALQREDAKLLVRLNSILEDCRRHPFTGIGKPEPLGGNLSGWWSRRINSEHRLVYRVIGKGEAEALEVAQCRYSY